MRLIYRLTVVVMDCFHTGITKHVTVVNIDLAAHLSLELNQWLSYATPWWTNQWLLESSRSWKVCPSAKWIDPCAKSWNIWIFTKKDRLTGGWGRGGGRSVTTMREQEQQCLWTQPQDRQTQAVYKFVVLKLWPDEVNRDENKRTSECGKICCCRQTPVVVAWTRCYKQHKTLPCCYLLLCISQSEQYMYNSAISTKN